MCIVAPAHVCQIVQITMGIEIYAWCPHENAFRKHFGWGIMRGAFNDDPCIKQIYLTWSKQ